MSPTPSPTEAEGVANNNKISSITKSGNNVTINVDVDSLTAFPSSNPSQGTHKWLALEVATGVIPITDVKYNGEAFTAQDISDAEATGCSAGSFVLYIKADEVVDTPKSFTLSSEGKDDVTTTISIANQ